MVKKVLYNIKARKSLEKGMEILSRAVALTLGPKGKNVVLERGLMSPQIINDGVTIAQEIELNNAIQNIGVTLLRQAASKTNEVVGDGTTTSTVLAYSIVKQGLKSITSGANPVLIKKGIFKAVQFIVSKIHEYSRPVQELNDVMHIASISAGNDKDVGRIISTAIDEVGREGVILLEEGQSTSTVLDIKEGLQFDKGFISPYFVSDQSSMKIVQKNPYILLTDKKIKDVKHELLPLLEKVAKTGRPLLIIAEDVEKEALATLILNNLKGVLNVVAVRAPGFGDRRKAFLEDLAVLTKGDFICQELGYRLEEVSLDHMGSAQCVNIFKDYTTIIIDNSSAAKLRCQQIKKQMELSYNNYEKDKLQERLAKMSGKVAVIKLGAATETEMRHKKLRLEDAINATKAAMEEGIVPGGGATLVHLSQELLSWSKKSLLDEELAGALVVYNALLMPLLTIVQNSGLSGSLIVDKVKSVDFHLGYDANQGIITNMYLSGIIDPAKVTRLALQNAASIASIILTTDCIIAD